MTPRDLLGDLRDIHAPEELVTQGDIVAIWPLALFALLLACGAGWSYWRGRRWRRQAAAELKRAQGLGDPTEKWMALVDLLRRVSRSSPGEPAPDYVFQPPDQVSANRAVDLAADIARRIA